MPRCNSARGEILASLGGREVRLCVMLRTLSDLEAHFSVSGFEALAERLKMLSADDLTAVLQALCVDDVDISALDIAVPDAIAAIVAAFEAMHE